MFENNNYSWLFLHSTVEDHKLAPLQCPLVGGAVSVSTMGWGHVVKHHMHNMPSRVNMMKHDTATTIHLRTTPLCDTNGRTQVIYANVCAHRHA